MADRDILLAPEETAPAASDKLSIFGATKESLKRISLTTIKTWLESNLTFPSRIPLVMTISPGHLDVANITQFEIDLFYVEGRYDATTQVDVVIANVTQTFPLSISDISDSSTVPVSILSLIHI